MPESNALVLVGVGLVAVALAAWVFTAHRKRQKGQEELLDRVGFKPCPEEQGMLEPLVNPLVNDRNHHYEVELPRRLQGEPAIYHYVKVRDRRRSSDERDAGEELLFRVRRRSDSGVVLVVKPSSLAPWGASPPGPGPRSPTTSRAWSCRRTSRTRTCSARWARRERVSTTSSTRAS